MSAARSLLFIILVAFSSPSFALANKVDPEVSAINKVNVAGRQRMLSQKIAKSLCFAARGLATQAHLKEAKAAIELFEKSAHALRHGSTDMQMLPEDNDAILAALDSVDVEWESYGGALLPVLETGEVSAETLELLFHKSLSVLRSAHAAVGVMEAQFGGSAVRPEFATAINIAGRQRMLSQRAAKEYCLAISGIEKAKNLEALRSTMALFEDSIFALTFGSAEMGILEPEITLEWQFLDILSVWYYLKDLLEEGSSPDENFTHEILGKVAQISNVMLVESNRAVGMYVNWAKQN